MSQELVHAVLEPCEMQEVTLIENRPEERSAFIWHERTTQLHLPLHDQEDQKSVESAVQHVQQAMLLNLERQRPHLVVHRLAALGLVIVLDVLQQLTMMLGREHQPPPLPHLSS